MIRIHDKPMIVLSKDSIDSTCVEREVVSAMEQEERQGRTILFPIFLDNSVFDTDKAWAADIRRDRLMRDFTQLQTTAAYRASYDRLLRDLKADA